MVCVIFIKGRQEFIKEMSACPAMGSHVEIRDKLGNFMFGGTLVAIAWVLSERYETATCELRG